MIYLLLIVNFCTFVYSLNSPDILKNIHNNNGWVESYRTNDGKTVYQYKSKKENTKFIKIEKQVNYSSKDIFDVIQAIGNYNEIISNNNIYTELVDQYNDTLYAYQKITNSIPFTRDRQYIFKMYKVNDNRIDWYIINNNNVMLNKYSDDSIHTLTYGAGSWQVISSDSYNILINRTFVDDEVSLPLMFIQRLRVSNVLAIFDDVLNYLEKKGN